MLMNHVTPMRQQSRPPRGLAHPSRRIPHHLRLVHWHLHAKGQAQDGMHGFIMGEIFISSVDLGRTDRGAQKGKRAGG
jgi:hypothetical protein